MDKDIYKTTPEIKIQGNTVKWTVQHINNTHSIHNDGGEKQELLTKIQGKKENMKKPIEEYEKHLRGNYTNQNTITLYLKHIRVFIKHMDWKIHRLTQQDINEYIHWCKTHRQHNGNTIRFNTITRFLKWYGRPDLTLPRQRMLPTNKHPLTQEQMITLCNTAKTMTWLHQLILTLELICLRRPEGIRNLKLKDKHGDILRYIDKTSHITGIKKEILSNWTIKAWDNYVYFERPTPKTEQDAQYLILATNKKHYGQHLKSTVMVSRVTNEIGDKCKLETPNGENWINYLIKRTGITQQAHICPNLKIVSNQAGHNNIETTMLYDKIMENDTRKHLENFEQVINQKTCYNHIHKKPEKVISYITEEIEKLPRISYNNMMEDGEDNSSFSFSISSFFINNFCDCSRMVSRRGRPLRTGELRAGSIPAGRIYGEI